MAMEPERSNSRSLHNFSLPLPNWGSCRYLRCVKDSEDLNRSLFINPIHDKLKPDLGFLKKRPRVSVVEERGCIDASAKPWNLRTRRAAACKDGRTASVFVDTKEEKVVVEEKRDDEEKKKKRVKLSVSLLKEEIEEDFAVMLRIRPPRRPKKRARIVQRHLDSIFPGLWLKEVTAEAYKVPDVPESSCF
ncbi:uncharacterized protein LOC119981415 [Tripterygium wilfordii]|uniref:uncharacterized protein LOC119981415 n=1 Tax=Tripterygium wilfordii TaxID=458696 RepID=UPI0018F84406|nr:uncharacterized protein LOC119981415 [Tripterygium wilfordii]